LERNDRGATSSDMRIAT